MSEEVLGFFGVCMMVVDLVTSIGSAISDCADEERKCYPYNRISSFQHGKHRFTVCARENGPEVRLVK